jgi:hypothetical protein
MLNDRGGVRAWNASARNGRALGCPNTMPASLPTTHRPIIQNNHRLTFSGQEISCRNSRNAGADHADVSRHVTA